MNTAILMLAAGASTRMGQPKMFLTYKGKTFLQRTAEAATAIGGHCFAVAGAVAGEITLALRPYGVRVINNPLWQNGMGSSIAAGIDGIQQSGNKPDAIIITVCDQPFISSGLLHQLITTQRSTGKGIIASAYNDTLGTPVLFMAAYFPQLAQLSGQQGAKKLLQQYQQDVASVPFPLGGFDIDTPEDYQKLQAI